VSHITSAVYDIHIVLIIAYLVFYLLLPSPILSCFPSSSPIFSYLPLFSHPLTYLIISHQIKTSIASKDDEQEHLEQAIHTERTKAARLDTLIKKRGTAPGGISVQGPGAPAGGKPFVVSGSTDSPVPRSLKVKATPSSTAGVGRGRGKEFK
jgi:hypothetical protein